MRVLTLALILAGLSIGREAGHAQDRPTGAPLAGTAVGADRPHVGREMGRLFISPMGEPFRSPAGGRNPIDIWFEQADTNHDGALTDAEFDADAARFFAILDHGHDGEIDPDDIEVYEDSIVPEVRVGGGGGGGGGRSAGSHGRGGGGGRRSGGGGFGGGGHRGGGGSRGSEGGDSASPSQPAYDSVRQGAARYGFFEYPEPITVADTDFNRGVSPKEFEAAADSRFAVLDRNGDGRVTRAELPRFDPPAAALAPPSRRPMERPHRDEDRDPDG